MIEREVLVSDLRKLLGELEEDLRTRCEEHAEVDAVVQAEYRGAREAGRTGQAYPAWRDEYLTQVAAAWILGTVFVRFMEDNDLAEPPRLAGPRDRLKLARDQHTLYFQQHPTETDREYLLDVFRSVAALPAARDLFDEAHNPVWRVGLSGDGAAQLLAFWQRIDPATGALGYDFTDPEWSTRFLGDLYQDLSESARKKYALLQTPDFIEAFILDRTLTPAIQEFGYQAVRLIDPACGSGHFLLGAFQRLFDLWIRHEPGTNARELARRALDQVYGVDLNPFAVAIARFRLLVSALRACDIRRLADAPAFRINVAAGDSLLHGPRFRAIRGTQATLEPDADPLLHVYVVEDARELWRILGQRYHAVVGNPPYITVKDRALNQAYRDRFGSCHMKYSLVIPFLERFFELALPGEERTPAGFVGLIAANSFMKREFGKKLIEEYIPHWDLTHVIDTSGAYIPGHGTPTVILFGRNRSPVSKVVRAVMGILGEPQTPDDPARGLVWTAILTKIDQAGSQSKFISVADVPRETFHKHPWSIGGGGAAELKEALDECGTTELAELVDSMGIGVVTGEDDAFCADGECFRRQGVPEESLRDFVQGDVIRDWWLSASTRAVFPYDLTLERAQASLGETALRVLWPFRTNLRSRTWFRKTQEQRGLAWFEYGHISTDKIVTPLSIAFAEVATHNHFVLDRGGKVFNQTAPIIKLRVGASEDDHVALVGLLNSSTACFWLKQTCHNKGSTVDERGARQRTAPVEDFYQLNGRRVGAYPVPAGSPLERARRLTELVAERASALPGTVVSRQVPTREALGSARERASSALGRMVALQEDLDWECYRLYGLLGEALTSRGAAPEVRLGERAFEIVMARWMARGDLQTTWFERHGSTPITEIPAQWPVEYRALVERRVSAIQTNRDIRLIEQPEYKRRWNLEPWETQEERALHGWLLDRLESAAYWPRVELTSCVRLADRAREDTTFMQVAELYRSRPDFDVTALVQELVESEAVPFLPTLRYTATGLRKRAAWEDSWGLQRLEDAIDARARLPEGDPQRLTEAEAVALKTREVGEIPVPPKYASADFQSSVSWRFRGKLDVPKERFVGYPGCERAADPTPVIGWAGWDQLQQAQALAAYYVAMRETEGWTVERLTPLLAGLLELVPWLRQWHNDVDATHRVRMGDYFAGFVEEEARAIGLTLDAVRTWAPSAGTTQGHGRRAFTARRR